MIKTLAEALQFQSGVERWQVKVDKQVRESGDGYLQMQQLADNNPLNIIRLLHIFHLSRTSHRLQSKEVDLVMVGEFERSMVVVLGDDDETVLALSIDLDSSLDGDSRFGGGFLGGQVKKAADTSTLPVDSGFKVALLSVLGHGGEGEEVDVVLGGHHGGLVNEHLGTGLRDDGGGGGHRVEGCCGVKLM